MRITFLFLSVLLLASCKNKRDRVDSLIAKGIISDSLGDYKHSSAIYSEALDIDPKNIIALTNKGRAMIVLGDTAGGLALLDRSLAIEPRAETMLSKAIIIGQKNPALVPGYMHSALSLNPAYLPALSTLAIYYSEVTPLKDSALYYASIISEKAPNLEITLLSLMSVYLSFSKYDSLIAVADRLAEKNPGYAYGFNNRGYAKMKKGNYDGARADIYHSLMLDSTNSYAYKNLGLLSIELKQKDSACFYLQKATAKGFRKLYGNEVDSLSTIYCR